MKYYILFIFILGISAFGFSQEEEKHPILTDKFYIEAGVFIPQKDIKFGADGSITEDIDFGKHLSDLCVRRQRCWIGS